MALLINKDVSILGTSTTNQIYTRLHLTYTYEGSYIKVATKNYISKDSYMNALNNDFNIDGIPDYINFNYLAESDGDLMSASHIKMKEFLSTDITKDVSVFDSSTGEFLNNDTEIITPKFCEESDISFVDVSINY